MAYDPTPPASCRYGAPMGRYTGPEPGSDGDKWQLRKIRIDNGGYDPGGAYWGVGLPLYWARNQDGAETFFRLTRDDYDEMPARCPDSRDVAKHVIRRVYDPSATFYR